MAAPVIEIFSPEEMRRTLTRLASQVIERAGDLSRLALVGLYTRGVPLAHTLAQQIYHLEQVEVPVGAMDITLYRDDFERIGVRPLKRNEMPQDLSGMTVVLVDDVIYRGRTARAALSALHEYGRPAAIWLVTLVDRGHREVPIHPDFVGKSLPTASDEVVKVYVQSIDGRDGVELLKPSR